MEPENQTETVEHLQTFEIERFAVDKPVLHLMGCVACQQKVTRFTEVLAKTPLDQYPPAE